LLPLHSMVAYLWGILVTWNFNLFPSFLFFAIGWAMLATSEFVKKNPSPWQGSRGYFEILRFLLLNSVSPETIPTNDRLSEINEFQEKIKLAEEKRMQRKEQSTKHDQEVEALQGQVATEDVDITSSSKKAGLLGNVSVNPLKPVLYPIQKELKKAVTAVRIAKAIVLWEATYFAFWITTLAFLACALVFFVPWAFLARWTLRIALWICLGPWMALVDKFYFQKLEAASGDDKAVADRLKARYAEVLTSAMHTRIRNERALKLKAMKRFCFGKFIVDVPRFKEDLHWDAPNHVSSACPSVSENVNIVEKIFGQGLKGDMVPEREVQVATKSKSRKKKLKIKKLLRFPFEKKPDQAEKIPLLSPEAHEDYQAIEVEQQDEAEATEVVPVARKKRLHLPWL
jgi:hypothetical protein